MDVEMNYLDSPSCAFDPCDSSYSLQLPSNSLKGPAADVAVASFPIHIQVTAFERDIRGSQANCFKYRSP